MTTPGGRYGRHGVDACPAAVAALREASDRGTAVLRSVQGTPCARLLAAALPDLIRRLGRFKELQIDDATAGQFLRIGRSEIESAGCRNFRGADGAGPGRSAGGHAGEPGFFVGTGTGELDGHVTSGKTPWWLHTRTRETVVRSQRIRRAECRSERPERAAAGLASGERLRKTTIDRRLKPEWAELGPLARAGLTPSPELC